MEDVLIHEGIDYKETMGNKGAQFNIRECPKCGKDSWKVYCNAESGLGNCFSCGGTFNVFRWVSWILDSKGALSDNRSVGEYLHKLRKTLGYRPKRVQAPKVVTTSSDIELPFSQPLPYQDGWMHPYLLSRRIDGHYAKMFDLRYSVFGKWQHKNDKGDTVTQSFAERILIPVYDLDGKLVTFQGRDATGVSDIRYKFAGGLPGTARYLYNGHVAKQTKAERVIMGEGAFDVIGIQRAIDQDSSLEGTIPIGSWGKHLSSTKEGADQLGAIRELRRNGLKEIICLYDGEPAAYEEAVKAAMNCSLLGLVAKVGVLPKNMDPGEADTSIILDAVKNATQYTRISGLRMAMNNPYK